MKNSRSPSEYYHFPGIMQQYTSLQYYCRRRNDETVMIFPTEHPKGSTRRPRWPQQRGNRRGVLLSRRNNHFRGTYHVVSLTIPLISSFITILYYIIKVVNTYLRIYVVLYIIIIHNNIWLAISMMINACIIRPELLDSDHNR